MQNTVPNPLCSILVFRPLSPFEICREHNPPFYHRREIHFGLQSCKAPAHPRTGLCRSLSDAQYIERPVFTRVGKFPALMPLSTKSARTRSVPATSMSFDSDHIDDERHIPGAPMTDTAIGKGSALLVTMESYRISPTSANGKQTCKNVNSKKLPGAVSSGARIIGAMFKEA